MSTPYLSDSSSLVTVLAVSPSLADHASLQAIFTHSRWRLYQVGSCAEAVSFLRARPIPVVIGDAGLPDGTWRDLLREVASLPDPPRLIVTSDLADDRLWAEALNLGAYDVLAKPFRAPEVFRTVSLAWRQWKDSFGTIPANFDNRRVMTAAAGY